MVNKLNKPLLMLFIVPTNWTVIKNPDLLNILQISRTKPKEQFFWIPKTLITTF